MSGFWSAWVIVLILINIGVPLFLFLWAQRVDIPTQPDGTTGHVWAHGALREGVRRLPTWWVVISAVGFVAGIGYLVLYPGFGAFKGVLGWTSQGELAQTREINQAREAALRERVRGKPVEAIAADPEALRVAEVLFVDNCAACHGRDAQGNRALGAPNLTDGDWLYGGDGKAILASIVDGRGGTMPPFGGSLSGAEILELANYVASLSGKPHDSLRAQLGKRLFTNCVPCHGADGKGNTALGAPNLTDGVWLYGGTIAEISETIRLGRHGMMPAWGARLGQENATLLAAWVYAQSHRTGR
ncbi:MAG: cytochrome-c oxidase, cbb3-type subunit III [Burkholderiales bacterium]|nr:cytochrome-c oxidase, cbb3-type subunit III [Burkholderiales bacterium]